MACYAELVCGPPGSGKTTYCEGKRQLMDAYGDDRLLVHVNLDPANDGIFPYPCDVDICGLVEHHEVMAREQLGPNGSYLFCIDYLASNKTWLQQELTRSAENARRATAAAAGGAAADRPVWFLIDCPGQVEFYVHSEGLSEIVRLLQKTMRMNVVMTHLCDATVATRDVPTYMSTCLLCLTAMVDLELPHINVLTKWDLLDPEDDEDNAAFLETGAFLDEHFTRMWRRDETRAVRAERRSMARMGVQQRAATAASSREAEAGASRGDERLKRMTRSLVEVIDGYNLVGYAPLNVQDEPMMRSLCDRIDMAAGLVR